MSPEEEILAMRALGVNDVFILQNDIRILLPLIATTPVEAMSTA